MTALNQEIGRPVHNYNERARLARRYVVAIAHRSENANQTWQSTIVTIASSGTRSKMAWNYLFQSASVS